MKRSDRLIAPSRGSVDMVVYYSTQRGAKRQPFMREYLNELWRLCTAHGFDFAIAAAQADNESESYTSAVYQQYGNTVGLGVTNSQNLSLVYQNGADMARAHIVHLWAYVKGRIPAGHELIQYIHLDPRYEAVFQARFDGTIKTLDDFNVNGRWALVDSPPYYGDRIITRGNRIFPGLEQGPDTQPTPTPTPTPQPSTRTFGQWLDLLFGKGWRITQDWAARGGPNLYAYGKGHGLDGSQHTGVDVGIPYGTKMYAPAPGKIVCAGTGVGSGAPGGSCSAYNDWGDGSTVKQGVGRIEIYYQSLNASLIYGHSRTAAVKPGDMVQAGQYIGTSGGMHGPHIHLEYIQWGTAQGWTLLDPRVLLSKFGGSPAPPEEDPSMALTFGKVPHPPYERYILRKDPGHGHRIGTRRPRGCVHHEWMDGGEAGEAFYKGFFQCPSGARHAEALVDYVILRNGKAIMLNDPRSDRIPYASGGSGPYRGDGGPYAARFGAASVNADLVSWEFAKRDNENLTQAQIQTGGELAAFWHDQDGQRWDEHPYTSKYGLVVSFLHHELGATTCGLDMYDDISKIQAVTKGVMKFYQTQAATQPQPQPVPQPTPPTPPPIVPIPPDVPPLPEPALPGGKTEQWWKDALGPLWRWRAGIWTGPHSFDPNGVISLAYAHRAWAEQTFPKAKAWYVLPERDVAPEDRQQIVQFSNSWELRFLNERAGWLWLDLLPPAVVPKKG